jgi:nitrogen regulatory protein P-II 1
MEVIMKSVTAIVRMSSLERVVKAFELNGIHSMTISEIKGLGEEVRLNNPYSIHDRIELFVSDDKADAVVKTILENSRTGLAGDGVIAVATLDYAVKIRTAEKVK